MGRPQYIPSFFFYKFAQTLADPYTSFEAYRAGNIDAQGNIIANESNIDPFEYFVIKLKKIMEELPPGATKYKTNNLFGVMQLFSEQAEYFGITNDDFNILVEAELMAKELTEDMTTGGAAGAIGTPAEAPGANKGNVSGYDPVMGSMATRSGPVNMFASVEMFNIPASEYKLFKLDKGYPKTATGNYVRRYGQRNSGQKLAVRDEESGEIYWLPATNKKTFVEEYKLNNLKILKESSLVEPETTPTGRTAKSEVWALKHIKQLFDKNGFVHVPWGRTITGPRQYQISPGQRGREDIVASNSDGDMVPVESKSIRSGGAYSSFNLDLSTQGTPKGVATYSSVAHGLADIYDPEYEEYQSRILRDKPIQAVSAELERVKGIKFLPTQIPGIRWKPLKARGIYRLGTPQKASERVRGWRKGLLDMVGNEKSGAVFAVNPEERHLHVLNLDTGEKASAVNKLLADLGGLRTTGNASTSHVGAAMYTPDPKMAKSSHGTRMLRVGYRFKPDGDAQDPWIENGRNAFDDQIISSREDFKDWKEVLDRLTRAE